MHLATEDTENAFEIWLRLHGGWRDASLSVASESSVAEC